MFVLGSLAPGLEHSESKSQTFHDLLKLTQLVDHVQDPGFVFSPSQRQIQVLPDGAVFTRQRCSLEAVKQKGCAGGMERLSYETTLHHQRIKAAL